MGTNRTKLMIIVNAIPYPLNVGGMMAFYSMVDGLRNKMDISLIFNLRYPDQTNLEKLQQLWPNVKFYVYVPQKTKSFYFQKIGERLYQKGVLRHPALRNFVSPFSKYTPELTSYILNVISTEKPDIVQTEFYPNQDLVYLLPDYVKKVFVQHEIHYVVNKMWLQANNLCNNSYAQAIYRKLKAEEISAMNEYDMVLTLNAADKDRITQDGVKTPTYTSPVGVISAPTRNACKYTNKIVFIGAGGHPPNVEALDWFSKNVWPQIIEKYPTTKFHIIGSWNESQQKPFSNIQNLIFDGFVDNLGDALNGAIAVVPILSGSGIRMKILDAVNYGAPFISTTIGALDMGFVDGRDCFIADTAEDFAKKLLLMIEDESIRELFYENSMQVYQNIYSQKALVEKRFNLYQQLLAQ